MHDSNKRYIITGGSGSGKTTLINFLSELNYICFPEVSRIVIKEQQQKEGDLLPWNDLKGFTEACFRLMKTQLVPINHEQAFYDRGIPDIVAYLRNSGLFVPAYLEHYASYYNAHVFICPPWREIFENDPQRPESFEESERIYYLLREVYQHLGFQLISVPKLKVEKRVQFILSYIQEMPE